MFEPDFQNGKGQRRHEADCRCCRQLPARQVPAKSEEDQQQTAVDGHKHRELSKTECGVMPQQLAGLFEVDEFKCGRLRL